MQRTGSILVVDNEPTIVDLIVEILTDEGYVAYAAPDGASALATIAHHPPALLLLDVRMPGMSGAELITALHGAGLATMPMVLMTTSPRDAAPLLAPGLIECLVKPFDLDELLTCVARYAVPPQQRINYPLRVQFYRFDEPDVAATAVPTLERDAPQSRPAPVTPKP